MSGVNDDWRGRIVLSELWVFETANPVNNAAYRLGDQSTSQTFRPTMPRAVKLVGYGISTLCLGDTVPGNWTVVVRNAADTIIAQFDVNVTTTQTNQHAGTVPWSSAPILQAGETFRADTAGTNKNGFFSFLTLEWEII